MFFFFFLPGNFSSGVVDDARIVQLRRFEIKKTKKVLIVGREEEERVGDERKVASQ